MYSFYFWDYQYTSWKVFIFLLPNWFQFKDTTIREDDDSYRRNPTLSEKMHCVLFVINADTQIGEYDELKRVQHRLQNMSKSCNLYNIIKCWSWHTNAFGFMKCKYFKFIFSFDISHLILKTDDSRISFGILISLKTLQMQIKSKKTEFVFIQCASIVWTSRVNKNILRNNFHKNVSF